MSLDEKSGPVLIDHVGVRLWRLANRWKVEFESEMLARGYPWVAEARGAIIGHLRPGGLPQSALAGALGVSKQAVQQFVDELVEEGVVERVADPADGRGKIVRLTTLGVGFIEDGNEVKRAIERRYRGKIGKQRLADLNATLEELAHEEPK